MNTGNASKTPFFYKALMVAIAVVTLLAVWLVPDDDPLISPPLPELPGAQKGDTGLSQPADGSAAVMPDGDRARAFVASLRSERAKHDLDTVFVEAERLQGEGYSVDAHLLYRFAARHGHGPAAMALGTQADPAVYTVTTPDSLQDNPEQAYKWYSMAAAAGIEEAVTRLQVLHQNVALSASAGDERAQRLLLLWK